MATDTMIRLWTIQTPLAWSLLQQHHSLSGDGRRADPDFRTAYRWLMEQMTLRTKGYTGRFPIWFWMEKPDFRKYQFRNYCKPGESVVLLECLIPAERVLLSDYESWHSVLNNWHLSLSEEEADEFYSRLNTPITREQALSEKRVSWERIFDFDLLGAHPNWFSEPTIQATVETLHEQEVVKARVITPKRTWLRC